MGGSGQVAKASGKGCEHVTGWCSCSSLGGTLTCLVQPCLALSDVLAASSGKRGWRKQRGGRLHHCTGGFMEKQQSRGIFVVEETRQRK